MTHTAAHVHIATTSHPSTPSWFGEVAVLAHVLRHLGLQQALEERVQFARARMGTYDVLDFVMMLLGYVVSGEPTLKAFHQRLLPFAEPYMALFGGQSFLIRQRCPAFLRLLIAPRWRRFAPSFRRIWSHTPSSTPRQEGCGIDRGSTGSSSM